MERRKSTTLEDNEEDNEDKEDNAGTKARSVPVRVRLFNLTTE